MFVPLKRLLSAASALLAAAAFAGQPPLTADPVVNAPCDDGPKTANGKPIAVGTPLDSGFVSLFNGTDLTGWWENCAAHSSDKVKGGLWIVDPATHAIYSTQVNGNGGMLTTNETFDNYELVVDIWPSFGNDGGVFNRVTRDGKCWQTGLDYIKGSSVGGSYNEGGWIPGASINDDPYVFGDTPANPSITTWTAFTKGLNPASFGCSSGGCVGADFTKIWDVDGWNQLRVKFFDGLASGREVHMQTWLRKAGAAAWTPIYDSHQSHPTAAGPVALQIHGGDKWKAGAYNLYRNIKIRKLDLNGEPLTVTAMGHDGRPMLAPRLRLAGGELAGTFGGPARVELLDTRGRVLDAFRAGPGELRRALPAGPAGLLIARITDAAGRSASLPLSRL